MKRGVLTRLKDNGKQTEGRLDIYDEFNQIIFSCLTLERPWLNNKRMVSCIATGDRIVKWGHMNSVGKDHYEIINVDGRTAIFFHGGNRFVDSHGCILLGYKAEDIDHDGNMDITNSGNAIKDFETIMCKQPFELSIVNSFSAAA